MRDQVVLVDFEMARQNRGLRQALPAHVQNRDRDQQVELGLGPNPDAPGHSRRFSSVNTSSAVRPRLPSSANVARRRLISATCQSGRGSASASGARLAQSSSIRSSRSDTLRLASSVAFGMDATCATLHLQIALRKARPVDDSGSAPNCATSRESVAIQTIQASTLLWRSSGRSARKGTRPLCRDGKGMRPL